MWTGIFTSSDGKSLWGDGLRCGGISVAVQLSSRSLARVSWTRTRLMTGSCCRSADLKQVSSFSALDELLKTYNLNHC